MLETAIISFSEVHIILLSNDAPSTISCPAFSNKLLFLSTITGGFPPPAATTFLPLTITFLINSGPPVTTKTEISYVIKLSKDSIEGSSIINSSNYQFHISLIILFIFLPICILFSCIGERKVLHFRSQHTYGIINNCSCRICYRYNCTNNNYSVDIHKYVNPVSPEGAFIE